MSIVKHHYPTQQEDGPETRLVLHFDYSSSVVPALAALWLHWPNSVLTPVICLGEFSCCRDLGRFPLNHIQL